MYTFIAAVEYNFAPEGGVAVEILERDRAVELRNARVRVCAERDPVRLEVEGAGGALRGLRPRLVEGGRERWAGPAAEPAVERVETAAGAATRVTLIGEPERGAALELRVTLGDDWPGCEVDLAVHHVAGGDGALRVDALDLSASTREGGAIDLPGPARELRMFRMGYQSWSPAGWSPLRTREPQPRTPLSRDVLYGPFTPPQPRGMHGSDFATSLRGPGRPGLTLGFLTHRRFLSHLAVAHRGDRPQALTARAETEGATLAPGARLDGETLWVGFDGAGEDGLATWAERAGRAMGAPRSLRVGSAWCSWYQYFTAVTAEDVRSGLRELAALGARVDTVQVDDGYPAAIGDWLEPGDGFPDGIAPLGAEIRAAGFGAGLWLAPFLVSRESRVARDHPDWLRRDARGRPRVAMVNAAWKGRVCHALDPTHPGVCEWLSGVARAVRGFGFDYLKLDFLYAGALAGPRHDPAVPSAEAYRRGIEALRAGAPDAFRVGCGAPLGPSIGLFHAMRIGPDVAPHWRPRGRGRRLRVRAAPAAEHSVRNVLARASLHQRLWINDPDCALLRDRDTGLHEREVRTLVATIALSGGLTVVSDDLERVGPGRRRMLERLLPALGLTPEPLPLDGELPGGLWVRLPDGGALVLRVNLDRRARSLHIDPAALGLEPPLHVYDVWEDAHLGVRAGPVPLDSVPARGCRLLRLTPARGGPRVIGSTLHVGAGALEARSVVGRPDGTIALALELPGRRSGRVHVAAADGSVWALEVGFEDRIELELATARVEDGGAMGDG